MRILLVADYYPPFLGGGHRQSLLLAQGLAAQGHTVAVATPWQDGLPAHETDARYGFPVYRVHQVRSKFGAAQPGTQRHSPPFPDPVMALELRRIIRAFKPEVVNAYGWIAHSAMLAMWGMKTPLIATSRDYGYSCATRTMLYEGRACSGPALGKCAACSAREYGTARGLVTAASIGVTKRLLPRRADGYHDISSYLQDITRRDLLGGRANRPMRVIHDIHNEEAPEAVADHLDGLPDEPYILFVGGLQKRKGIDVLLAAYAKMTNPPPLVIVGYSGPNRPPNLDPRITILENLPHSAVMAAWGRSLFGVLPSLWPEPLGDVVIEGMTAGKAVIGSRPGGHEDLIRDGETGLLVESGHVDGLAAAMQRLTDDDMLRDRLAAAALRKASSFHRERIIPQFEALYREVMGRPARVRRRRGAVLRAE